MTVDTPDIDICVCTYRRTHLAETLRSLSQLTLRPQWKLRVIVADNDETPSARRLAEQTAADCSLTLVYIHAPVRNISVARNACLKTATAPLVAFIDDDEIAGPSWLESLVATLEATGADVVLGPVEAIYAPAAPGWMQKGEFHSINPVWVRNEIITGYTCNALFRRTAPAFEGLRFRKELGRSGGEDTLFFSAAHRAGAKITFAPQALVTEAVAAERMRLTWLIKRYFRSGQTHGLVMLEKPGTPPLTRAENIAIGCAKAMFCLVAVLPNLARTDRAAYWFLRGTMHAGVVARLLGKRELEQYG